MRRVDVAWAAGFFDGEGTVRIIGNGSNIYVSQKVKYPLEKFMQIFDGKGKIYYRQMKTPSGKPTETYIYYLGGMDGISAMVDMLPYLTVKKEITKRAVALHFSKDFYRHKELVSSNWAKYELIGKMREKEGMTYKHIAEQLSLSHQRIQQLYKKYRELLKDSRYKNLTRHRYYL